MNLQGLSERAKRTTAAGSISFAGGAYLLVQLRDGWIPWDEGSLALTAGRVLNGELPHRDFLDLYTGGLTFLNAEAFKLFGIDLLAPRIILLLAFTIWVRVFFELCSRFLPTWLSMLATALAIVWSVPNYPAAVPSWYNLFFATGGLLALVLYSDTRNLRWMLVAGLCGGLSILAKITGVFFVLGASLFLIFDEQISAVDPDTSIGHRTYTPAIMLFSAAVVFSITHLVLRVGSPARVIKFLLPFFSLLSVLAIEEWRRNRIPTGPRSRYPKILRPAALLVLGVVLPLSIFSLPYLMSGSIADLLDGVFVRPTRRLDFASLPPPPSFTFVFTFLVASVLWFGVRLRPSDRRVHFLTLLALGAAAILASRRTMEAFLVVYLSAYNVMPIVILSGCFWVAFKADPDSDRGRLFALLSIVVGVGMVEFPYSGGIYFYYTAPLTILALVALAWEMGDRRLTMAPILVPWAFYFFFAVGVMNSRPPGAIRPTVSDGRWHELALPRAHLRTSRSDSLVYQDLMRILRTRQDHRLGYAGPDAPEVYFLAGSEAKDPILFDFLFDGDGAPLDDPDYLDGYNLIVLNHRPAFSPPIRPSTMRRLAREFPSSALAGRFEVRWRE